MTDPGFMMTLTEIPDVGSVEIIDQGATADTSWISARLVYDGSIDPLVARVLGSDRPTWVQTYRMSTSTPSGRLEIQPDHHGSLLQCQADITLAPAGGGTHRTLRGELVVRIPLLGGRAERSLMPAILARIDAEALLLDRWLGNH